MESCHSEWINFPHNMDKSPIYLNEHFIPVFIKTGNIRFIAPKAR